MIRKKIKVKSWLFAIMLGMTAMSLAACSPASDPAPTDAGMEEMDHIDDSENMDDMEHMEDMGDLEHEGEEVVRIPNEGASISIVSPEDGAVFANGEDFVVEIELENFTLNQDGSHWHVYVDGVSFGMVVGDTTTQVLRNLEPGMHEISAYLANGDHEELEDGAVITVMIEE